MVNLLTALNIGDYAIDNKFVDETSNFIEKKKSSSKFKFAFIYENTTYGVWFDFKEGKIFISSDYVKDTPFVFTTTIENHKENTLFFKSARKYTCWRMLIEQFEVGNVRFENQKIKNITQNLIKSLLLA